MEKITKKKLHNLYLSFNIVWVTKTMRMREVGHKACMKAMKNYI